MVRINDKDVKDLVVCVGDINVKLGVIQEKCANMESFLENQNTRLCKQEGSITKLCIEQEGIKTKIWILVFVGSLIGGVVVSVLSKVIGF